MARFLIAICLLVISLPPAFMAPRAAAQESRWLDNVRQLTFEGRRSGEGYFGPRGRLMVFQSERDRENPFYQIYLLDTQTGDIDRISPGYGKTTCAWIHPDRQRILFASTHADPQSQQLQQEELAFRESGQERRYAWDYDPHFDLYVFDRETQQLEQLTKEQGYDAEGSYSPDGQLIAFASNRQAFQRDLSPAERASFELDPAVMNEIYLMRADGSEVRRLTNTLGYDGGPFFSPDGQRICWRRFAANGATAEIMTMKVDGSDQRQLTHLDAMSWAPFYHPSGKYLIFTTNVHGFANFELYLVDAAGQREPVRVTETDGFDGLPVFTPDGNRLAWTSNRNSDKQSQIYWADWNHAAALQALKLAPTDHEAEVSPTDVARQAVTDSSEDFLATDIMRHVDYLCRPELGGRMTGTPGEQLATSYVAAIFDQLGLQPAGDEGWFQPFEFTAGVALGEENILRTDQQSYVVGRDWQPLSFSKTGTVAAAPIVFGGYGIVAPADGELSAYDSFVHLDVQDKWILTFRFMPEDITAEQRQHLSRHASLRFKAMVARDRGARGLIVVSGPQAKVRNQLVPLQFDGSLAGTSVPVISVTDSTAQGWLASVGKDLGELQSSLDNGEPQLGFEVTGTSLTAEIDIEKVSKQGRNVLGRLQVGERPSEQAVLVGAHIDHLGTGRNSSSLARDDETSLIHVGADDNASGVAGMLEIAEYLAAELRSGPSQLQRDVIFAAWSGEELGLIGSNHFANAFTPPAAFPRDHGREAHSSPAADNHEDSKSLSHGTEKSESPSLYPAIVACLNMDMIGRFDKRLVLQGVGSSSIWKSEIERRNVPVGLPITLQEDSYLPTDASTFFMRGVPILSAFTGSHSDYHTPRDTPDKLNYKAAAKIARFMGLVTRSLSRRDTRPDYVAQQGPQKEQRRARLRAYLGTIPDYAESEVKGLKLSGVAQGGPAAQAGLQSGDVIVELAGRKIENIYDYTYAIEALKIGQQVKVTVVRDDKRQQFELVPGSRD